MTQYGGFLPGSRLRQRVDTWGADDAADDHRVVPPEPVRVRPGLPAAAAWYREL